MRFLYALPLALLVACASGPDRTQLEPTIVPREKKRVVKSGFLPPNLLPAERDGVTLAETGAVMFCCCDAPNHEDREVFISKCPSCTMENFFFWDYGKHCFVCYYCESRLADAEIRCPDCGRAPRRVRTRPKH
jgi:hypothetical protein